jgi:5-methylcytosine-specific restriction endonuclease McrA
MAKRRGIAVTLTFKEYLKLTKVADCHYCGLPIQWAPYRKAGKPFGHNVDRKDAAKPYTKANCVPCCPGCNESKMSRTYKEWVVIGKAIKAYRESK